MYWVTQENSIENSVQDHLPYISQTTSLCITTLAYPKWSCVCLKANMCITVIFQTPKHVQLQHDIKSLWLFGFICAQNSVGGLVLYNKLNFIKSLQLSESKSVVIFICIHCLIISFKLCKFTWTLRRVFPSPNLNSYLVFHYWNSLRDMF